MAYKSNADAFFKKLEDSIAKGIDETTAYAERSAKRRVKKDTGELKQSIHTIPARKTEDGKISGALVSDAPHARYQEFGENGKPFLRPAMKTARRNLIKRIRKHMD